MSELGGGGFHRTGRHSQKSELWRACAFNVTCGAFTCGEYTFENICQCGGSHHRGAPTP